MEFVKVGNGGRFHSSIYHKLIDGTVSYTFTPLMLLMLYYLVLTNFFMLD